MSFKPLAILTLFTVLTSGASGAIIFSNNFDAENGGVAALDYSSFTNFTVLPQGVDLLGNGTFDLWPGNGLYVDLAHDFGGGLSTALLNLVPGDYVLSFSLAGNGASSFGPEFETFDSVTVTLGSFSETFTLFHNEDFSTFTRLITIGAPVSISLVFDATTDPDGAGLKLDNVLLEEAPEPGTFALLALGGGLLALKAYRRRRSSIE